jgi:hypothetical protein
MVPPRRTALFEHGGSGIFVGGSGWRSTGVKKQRVKLLLLAAVGAGALAIVVALSWPARPVPAFRFLHGREPTKHHLKSSGETVAFYRLEGDFNDLCAEAVAELADLGFYEATTVLQNHGDVLPGYRQARYFASIGPNANVSVFIGQRDGEVDVSVERMRHAFRLGNWPRYLVWRIRNRKQLESQRVRPEPGTGARRH